MRSLQEYAANKKVNEIIPNMESTIKIKLISKKEKNIAYDSISFFKKGSNEFKQENKIKESNTNLITIEEISNDKKKEVITIDQYGLRDFGDKFFNPMQQTANDFVTFQKLVPDIKKSAILMNENYYKTNANWSSNISKKLKEKLIKKMGKKQYQIMK